jgi:hypothetical protein
MKPHHARGQKALRIVANIDSRLRAAGAEPCVTTP